MINEGIKRSKKETGFGIYMHLISQMHVNKVSGIYLPTGEAVIQHPKLAFLAQADYAAFNIFELEGDDICLVKGDEYSYENL